MKARNLVRTVVLAPWLGLFSPGPALAASPDPEDPAERSTADDSTAEKSQGTVDSQATDATPAPASSAKSNRAPDAAPQEAQGQKAAPRDAESAARSRDTAATQSARSQAERAGEQAKDAQAKGHPLVAERYQQVQKMWLKVVDSLIEAAKLEERAELIETETTQLETQSRKAIMLVEQTEERRARALAHLRELGIAPAAPAAAPLSSPPPRAGSTSDGAPQLKNSTPPGGDRATTPKDSQK